MQQCDLFAQLEANTIAPQPQPFVSRFKRPAWLPPEYIFHPGNYRWSATGPDGVWHDCATLHKQYKPWNNEPRVLPPPISLGSPLPRRKARGGVHLLESDARRQARDQQQRTADHQEQIVLVRFAGHQPRPSIQGGERTTRVGDSSTNPEGMRGSTDMRQWFDELGFDLHRGVTDEEIMESDDREVAFRGGPLDGLKVSMPSVLLDNSTLVRIRPSTSNCELPAEVGIGNRIELHRHLYSIECGALLLFKGVVNEGAGTGMPKMP